MRDITDLMQHYRIAARSIWNMAFWSDRELRTWGSWDRFEQIKKMLFDALVVAKLKEDDCCKDLAGLPNDVCRIVPLDPGPVPIMIHQPREGDRNRYWDDPVREVRASETELQFLDYFDWNCMDYIDFQYYKVRIVAFPSRPHLVGREALLQHSHARVLVPDPIQG